MKDMGLPLIEETGPAPIDSKISIAKMRVISRLELIYSTLEAADVKERSKDGLAAVANSCGEICGIIGLVADRSVLAKCTWEIPVDTRGVITLWL